MSENEKNTEILKGIISTFYRREYDCSPEEEDFSDPKRIPIAYGTADELEDVEIQAYVDIEDNCIIREVNNEEYETLCFESATELATYLFWASFSELTYLEPELARMFHLKALEKTDIA